VEALVMRVSDFGIVVFLVAFTFMAVVHVGAFRKMDGRADRLEEELHRTKQEVCHLQIGHPPDYGQACLYGLGLTKEKGD
jgi:hypothetical protein